MGIWLMTAAANLVVGALVGLCGVAGFLLPMFYKSYRACTKAPDKRLWQRWHGPAFRFPG